MRARKVMNAMLIGAGVLAAVLLLAWTGLQIQPAPFPEYRERAIAPARTVPLPSGLPAPVGRFYRRVYGDRLPVVDSVVITGRGRIAPFGVWLPARFRFTHDAGRGYRHYIEACWFGIPFLKVNERYIDGRSLMEIPIVGSDSGPRIEQAGNIGMWAELSSSAPSVFLTDDRVRWEPVDEHTALLVVPFGEDATETLVARFDPASGALSSLEAMRFRDSKSAEKILWIAASRPGRTVGDHGLPAVGTATWLDMGSPWAYFGAEDIRTNVDVREYIRAKGL